MDDLFNLQNNFSLNNILPNCDNLDLNALLVILLILTGKLRIESITVFPNDFTVTLGTFRIV
jgi:hypothetical protein